jgi:hypothetical protein
MIAEPKMSGHKPAGILMHDALHAQIAKRQTEQEAISALRIANRLIVAPPR